MPEQITNFHTHTSFCKHAGGLPADYAEAALKDGRCRALGFSDHVCFPDDVECTYRMFFNEMPEYCSLVNEIKGKYPFDIFLGFECEWRNDYSSWYNDYLRKEMGADYLVLATHWYEKNGEFLFFDQMVDRKDFTDYSGQVIEAIESGCFDFLAHPDIMMMSHDSWDTNAKDCLIPVIEAAVKAGLPLEINGNGIARPMKETSSGLRYMYPVREFWKEAKARKALVVCNSDAHSPKVVVSQAVMARQFAEEMGIKVLDRLSFMDR